MPQDLLFDEMIKRAAEKYPLQGAPTSQAQPRPSSKIAQGLFLGGALADIGTTAYGTARDLLKEDNPLINWAGPKWQLPIGAAMEGGAYYLGNKLLKNHPKIRNAVLAAAGGLHGGLAINNFRGIKKSLADLKAGGHRVERD